MGKLSLILFEYSNFKVQTRIGAHHIDYNTHFGFMKTFSYFIRI